jgi:hypothetical protein
MEGYMSSLVFCHPAHLVEGDEYPVISAAGSGTFACLASFGAGGFGFSIAVNSYQDNNYVSSADGQTEYPGGAASGALPNLKYDDATHAYVANESSGTLLQSIAVGEATLKIIADGFGASVLTQNVSLRASDRTSSNNDPSGITVQAFEIIDGGTGDTSWTNIHGTTDLDFADQTAASSHNFYMGISVRPVSLGSKEYLYTFALEAI